MTTPRVTVPVEDLAGKLKAIRDKFLMPTPDKDFTDYAIMTRCVEALSAAPAPEGGAVSIWSDARNVFVRYAELFAMTERYEEASAIADKAAREIEALATREEAPAPCKSCNGSGMDAGSRFNRCPDCCEEAPAGAGEVRRAIKCLTFELDRVHPNHKTMFVHVADLRVALSALRAQPPAREDAQPVAWRFRDHPKNGWVYTGIGGRHDGCEVQSLYTHPAPDALREAVEALKMARDYIHDVTTGGLVSAGNVKAILQGHTVNLDMANADLAAIDQALAALQAEQKGGA